MVTTKKQSEVLRVLFDEPEINIKATAEQVHKYLATVYPEKKRLVAINDLMRKAPVLTDMPTQSVHENKAHEAMAKRIDAKQWVNATEFIVDNMTGANKQFLTVRYIKQSDPSERGLDSLIMDEYHLAPSTYYSRRREALTEFARLFVEIGLLDLRIFA